MTAHFSDGIVAVPLSADVDMTDWQFRLVVAASTNGNVGKYNNKTIGSSSPAPIGILLNDPSAGQEATVQCLGFAKAAVEIGGGCDLKLGIFLTPTSLGSLKALSLNTISTEVIVGRYLGPRTTTAGSYYGNVLWTGAMFPASGVTLPEGL